VVVHKQQLEVFLKCLKSPYSALEDLNLSGSVVHDSDAVKIIAALVGNSSLTSLDMSGDGVVFSKQVLHELKYLLCDTTRIDSITTPITIFKQ
jgi:hypothetical protein